VTCFLICLLIQPPPRIMRVNDGHSSGACLGGTTEKHQRLSYVPPVISSDNQPNLSNSESKLGQPEILSVSKCGTSWSARRSTLEESSLQEASLSSIRFCPALSITCDM